MGDIVFAEGVLANMWAGIFMRVQKSAPGPFSPFSFDEATAISDSSENDRSLILEIYTLTKGGLIKSIDDVKALAKTAGTVPQDFHSFNFQLKVFTIAVVFVFGKDSILATKLRDFVTENTASTKTELRSSTRLLQRSCGRWTASPSYFWKTAASATTVRTSTRG